MKEEVAVEDFHELVIERLRALRRTPGMWAHTREAFAAQLALLLDLLGTKPRVYDVFHIPGTSAADVASLVAEVDDEWARALVDSAAARAGLDLEP